MAQRKGFSGLIKRGEVWHIDKMVRGRRICESCETKDQQEAQQRLAFRLEELRQTDIYGVRPIRTFRAAAIKYLKESYKKSLHKDAWNLKRIEAFIGHLPLNHVHIGTLQPYIEHGKKKGWKNRTINMPLEVVRHILNLAASEWLDENGLTWLEHAPKIRLLPRNDSREPYPLSWEEQNKLFAQLPFHLREMCLFAVNTGCREQEICGLKWEYEIEVPELETSVFIIPKERVKNKYDRLVVINIIAREVIERQRGRHPDYVFSYRGSQLKSMNNTAWKMGRTRVGLKQVRIHDLKHTFGRRLRSAGVSLEDRKDLLGHKSGGITSHYSKAELMNLIDSANKVCGDESRKSPALVLLKKKIPLRVVGNATG